MNSTPTQLPTSRDRATYLRPPWMTDAQWAQASVSMTEHWLMLLDREARRVGTAVPGSPA